MNSIHRSVALIALLVCVSGCAEKAPLPVEPQASSEMATLRPMVEEALVDPYSLYGMSILPGEMLEPPGRDLWYFLEIAESARGLERCDAQGQPACLQLTRRFEGDLVLSGDDAGARVIPTLVDADVVWTRRAAVSWEPRPVVTGRSPARLTSGAAFIAEVRIETPGHVVQITDPLAIVEPVPVAPGESAQLSVTVSDPTLLVSLMNGAWQDARSGATTYTFEIGTDDWRPDRTLGVLATRRSSVYAAEAPAGVDLWVLFSEPEQPAP